MTKLHTRVIAGPLVTPIANGDVARVIERPGGGGIIEWWVKGTGWTEAPHGAFTLADFMPGYTRPVAAKDAARLDIPPAELDITPEEIAIAKNEMHRPRTIRGLLYGTVVSELPSPPGRV
jgi:hypothetical protein